MLEVTILEVSMSRLLVLFALLAFLPAVLHAAVATAAPSLDGRTFAIDLVEDDTGKAQGKDTLVFVGGSGDCETSGKKYGYAKGLCTVAKGKTKGEVAFRFAMTSPEHGDLLFEGTVQGKTIQGKRTWSKPGKTPIVHRFTGQQP
jgi:hypothetical protein